MKLKDTIRLVGEYRIQVRDSAGELKQDTGWFKNAVTTVGFAQLALLAGDATATPFTYLANGSDATAFSIGQTTLVAENTTNGMARAAATISRVTTTGTNDTYQAVYTWTASAAMTVNEVGVFNASSAGTMLSRAVSGTVVLATNDTLALTYKLKFA